METPSIFTYHCICSHLVLATTRDIFKLPRRQPPGLDGAIIVPLPPPPRSVDSDNESEDDDDDDDDEDDDQNEDEERMEIDQRGADPVQRSSPAGQQNESEKLEPDDPKDYTLLLSSIRDRRPCVIRREDGFEKRLLWRCGRCRLIFGYQIYDETLEELAKGEGEGDKKYKKRLPGKKYYVYILLGGLTTAPEMGSLTEADLQLLKED
ncbi:hypothetical protein ABW20_dc0108672 [Dactylellina cionopaga]|nr:hypothetical protein ABW20_dc0108672 [Dactylellina cionopaga]